jgi:hypothetical protein
MLDNRTDNVVLSNLEEHVIINAQQSFASRPFEERLRLGKQCAAQMLENLRASGYHVKAATTYDVLNEWKTENFKFDFGMEFFVVRSILGFFTACN